MLTLAIACLSLAARPIKNPVSPPGYSTKRGSLPTLIAQRVELATSSNKIANQCATRGRAGARPAPSPRARAARGDPLSTEPHLFHAPARASTSHHRPLPSPRYTTGRARSQRGRNNCFRNSILPQGEGGGDPVADDEEVLPEREGRARGGLEERCRRPAAGSIPHPQYVPLPIRSFSVRVSAGRSLTAQLSDRYQDDLL